MVVIHGTKKLLDRLPTPPAEVDRLPGPLGSWYATVLFWKPQVALLVDEDTYLPMLMPFAPAATLLQRFPAALETLLAAHGAPPSVSGRPPSANENRRWHGPRAVAPLAS